MDRTLAKFPAGTYYVGDPCYAIANDDWDEFLEPFFIVSDIDRNPTGGSFFFKGRRVWAHCTKWGDGKYTDNSGREYSVDSGSIGIIPEALVSDKYPREKLLRLGKIIHFENEFDVVNEDGTFYIGSVVIPTDSNEEDDEQDEEA